MTKTELALELLKMSTETIRDSENKTKNKIVEAYNYIYENLNINEDK